MKQPLFLEYDEDIEHQEHLYLLEVLVDNIQIEESKIPNYHLEPKGTTIIQAKFLDFPELLFDQGKPPTVSNEQEVPTSASKVIFGAPENWKIEPAKDLPDFERYPQYRVTIPYRRKVTPDGTEEVEDNLKALIPLASVLKGDWIKYVHAVLKAEANESTIAAINKQIEEAGKHKRNTADNKFTKFSFVSGKSLLFPMLAYKLIQGLKKSPLHIQVKRCGRHINDKASVTLLGHVKLTLGNSFVKAIMVAGRTKVLPVSAHIEDKYPISNILGDHIGFIALFLRLSCFGKSMFASEKAEPRPIPCRPSFQDYLQKKFDPLYSDECERPLFRSSSRNLSEKQTQPMPWRSPWDELQRFKEPFPGPFPIPPILSKAHEHRPPTPQVAPPYYYEPLPPMPPKPDPKKTFDIADSLPNLPRCGPGQLPPCYRIAGDRTMSHCQKDREAQLRREATSKFTQTEPQNQQPPPELICLEGTMKIVSHQQTDTPRPNTPCEDSRIMTKSETLQKRGYNTFDGIGQEKVVDNGELKKDGGRKCTCPKIPENLLPQPVLNIQCGCRCGAVKSKLKQMKRVGDEMQEKVSIEKDSIDATSDKERPVESKPIITGRKEAQQTVERREEKPYVKTRFPKCDDIFFLPGVDSCTHIALTTQECGYDLKRYLRQAEEMGEFDQGRKCIDPNPMAGLQPSKMPEEVKKALEKEAKKLEDKNPIIIDNTEKPSPATKKTKKNENQKDGDKESEAKAEGETGDESKADSKAIMKPKVKNIYKMQKVPAGDIHQLAAGMYPGVNIGHKYCCRPLRLVPKSMGWIWNETPENVNMKSTTCGSRYPTRSVIKPGRGWRPGAVRKNVNAMIKEWRQNNAGAKDVKQEAEKDMVPIPPPPPKVKRVRQPPPKSPASKKDPDTLKLNPTIHLHKKDRYYYVSMYPIKTESQEELGEEPQPIQFKIDRKHPDGKPSGEESNLTSTDSSSESSSYEVEYIAPAAMKPKKRKVEKSHMFTQCDEEEVKVNIKKIPEEQPSSESKSTKKSKKSKKSRKQSKKRGKSKSKKKKK